jgi:hypothetical protein
VASITIAVAAVVVASVLLVEVRVQELVAMEEIPLFQEVPVEAERHLAVLEAVGQVSGATGLVAEEVVATPAEVVVITGEAEAVAARITPAQTKPILVAQILQLVL